MRIFVLAAFLLSVVAGQGPDSESTRVQSKEIEGLLDKQLHRKHLVGIAAIIIRSNTTIGIAAAGVKRQGENIPLGLTDMWHLGSNTKAITATMIARLVESGRLFWTTTPLDTFPELKETMHPAFRQITIEQLLSHHAGIPPYANPEAWPQLSGSAVEQRSKFAASILEQAPAITPGTKGLYSNAGYVIAAAMAERKTKSSWEHLVTSEVLDPLRIHAIFGFPLSVDKNQPWGHTETHRVFKAVSSGAVELPTYLLPAGGLAMALGDYGTFLQMNLKGLEGKDDRFLPAKTIQRLHSSTMRDEYGLGWGVTEIQSALSSTHAGSAGNFYALVALQPSRDEGVAIVLNSGGERSSKAANELLERLLMRYAAAPE